MRTLPSRSSRSAIAFRGACCPLSPPCSPLLVGQLASLVAVIFLVPIQFSLVTQNQLRLNMKVCANLTTKPGSSDGAEKQILPQSLHDSTTAAKETRTSGPSISPCEERLESSLFLVLSFIVGLCVIGTFISIGGVLYLKYRNGLQSTTRQDQKIVSIFQSPAAMQLTANENHPATQRISTTAVTPAVFLVPPSAPRDADSLSEEVTIRDLEERLIPDQVTEALAPDSPAKQSPVTQSQPTTSMPSFVTVKNQWKLEQPPSAKQLVHALKQFFQFFKTGRYDVERIR